MGVSHPLKYKVKEKEKMGKYKTLWKSLKRTLKGSITDEEMKRILSPNVQGAIKATISTMNEMEEMYDRGEFDNATDE